MTPLGWIAPFAALLLAIAVLPVAAPRWWHSLRFQAAVAGALAAPVFVRLLVSDRHALGAVAHEYASFVLMLGALYVIASGILVDGDVPAHPATNAVLLLLGGLLASVIGTTGASILLIRLVLDVNVERRRVSHTVLFFILIVSNIGGALTPLGDPPLFLGYLSGVPFLWTLRLLPLWALSLSILLVVYLVVDGILYRRETRAALAADETVWIPITVTGRWNFALLAAVVAATALLGSPWREAAYVAAAGASFRLTPEGLRKQTGFSWAPIGEVAILFGGIFVAMEPALAVLRERANALGLTEPAHFFWAAGALSSCLDNAPTYAAFLSLARGLGPSPGTGALVAGAPERLLLAVSAGSVFFGALTYIGNGPNFLVRAIAVSRGVAMPSFFGYAWRAAAVLLPLFALHTLIFFR